VGAADLPRRNHVDKFLHGGADLHDAPYRKKIYLQMPTSAPNFNFLARLVLEVCKCLPVYQISTS